MKSSLPSGYKEVTLIENGVEVIAIKSIRWYKRKRSLKGVHGMWTKYGQRFNYDIDASGPWNCQSCGEEQDQIITPYIFHYQNDPIHVCAVCYFEQCKKLFDRLSKVSLFL